MSYIPRNARHEAIQFDGENMEKVCRWLRLTKDHVQLWINAESKDDRYLLIGAPTLNLGKIPCKYWIVRGNVDNDYSTMSEHDFKEKYEEI
jgi:hypothetical protein